METEQENNSNVPPVLDELMIYINMQLISLSDHYPQLFIFFQEVFGTYWYHPLILDVWSYPDIKEYIANFVIEHDLDEAYIEEWSWAFEIMDTAMGIRAMSEPLDQRVISLTCMMQIQRATNIKRLSNADCYKILSQRFWDADGNDAHGCSEESFKKLYTKHKKLINDMINHDFVYKEETVLLMKLSNKYLELKKY